MANLKSRVEKLESKLGEQSKLRLVIPLESLCDNSVERYYTDEPVGTLADFYEGKVYRKVER